VLYLEIIEYTEPGINYMTSTTISLETTYTPIIQTGPVDTTVATSQSVSGTTAINSLESHHKTERLKERLELTVEGAGLGVWDWDMTTDHVEFNDQWTSMLNSSSKKSCLIGRSGPQRLTNRSVLKVPNNTVPSPPTIILKSIVNPV